MYLVGLLLLGMMFGVSAQDDQCADVHMECCDMQDEAPDCAACDRQCDIILQRGFIDNVSLKYLQTIENHPFLTATALWLAIYKGPQVLKTVRSLGANWLVAIPVGGIILHKLSQKILDYEYNRNPVGFIDLAPLSEPIDL